MTTTDDLREVRARVRLRDHDRLRSTLAIISRDGWESEAATGLLCFVREDLVRPLVVGLGLRGAVASQAEATGWAVAWETLRRPGLVACDGPWGVVWAAVDRAVRGETVATKYATSVRKAWSVHREFGRSGMVRLVQWEQPELFPVPETADDGADLVFGPIRGALVSAGWETDLVARLVSAIVVDVERSADGVFAGWRLLARDVGVEPWRVRRLGVALLGDHGWPGLVALVAYQGCQVLDGAGARAAILATLRHNMRSPALEAKRAEEGTGAPCARGTRRVA